MKKIALLILSLLLLTSCSNNNTKPKDSKNSTNNSNQITQSADESKTKYTIKDYFPFKENIKLTYDGSGNEYTKKTVLVDFIRNNKIQLRTITSGNTLGSVFEIKDGELRLLTSKENFYYRDDLTNTENSKYEILLKEPLVKGTSWTLPNGNKRYISSAKKSISTDSGNYDALEVTTEYSNGEKLLTYYGLGVGPIKSQQKSDTINITSSLKKIEKNSNVTQTIKFYYPNIVENKVVFVKKPIKFKTNDSFKSYLEKYLKETPNKNLCSLIDNDVKINSVYFDTKKNMVMIDFSKKLLSNTGSSLESLALQNIANTLGDYYNTNKVLLTIQGKPYESGHILLKPNEPVKVDFKNISEYK